MKKKYYKLTKRSLKTYNGCQWKIGEWKETSGVGGLCSKGWLHAYTHPLLAVFLRELHVSCYYNMLFEVEVGGKMAEDNGLKVGFTKMRLIREIPFPQITDIQRIAFGILCVKEYICKKPLTTEDKKWLNWAGNWLNGKDRTRRTAVKSFLNFVSTFCYQNVIIEIYLQDINIKSKVALLVDDVCCPLFDCSGKKCSSDINLIKLAKKAATIT